MIVPSLEKYVPSPFHALCSLFLAVSALIWVNNQEIDGE
jgi:hypothetical protein